MRVILTQTIEPTKTHGGPEQPELRHFTDYLAAMLLGVFCTSPAVEPRATPMQRFVKAITKDDPIDLAAADAEYFTIANAARIEDRRPQLLRVLLQSILERNKRKRSLQPPLLSLIKLPGETPRRVNRCHVKERILALRTKYLSQNTSQMTCDLDALDIANSIFGLWNVLSDCFCPEMPPHVAT